MTSIWPHKLEMLVSMPVALVGFGAGGGGKSNLTVTQKYYEIHATNSDEAISFYWIDNHMKSIVRVCTALKSPKN